MKKTRFEIEIAEEEAMQWFDESELGGANLSRKIS